MIKKALIGRINGTTNKRGENGIIEYRIVA
jgi:hypothetical protein